MNHVYLTDNLPVKQAVKVWVIMLIFNQDLKATITVPFLFHANKSPIFLVVCQDLDEKIIT